MEKNTLQIIENIYNSIIDPSLWNNVLSSLVTLTNSESALLMACSNSSKHCGVYENFNIDPYWLKLYDEHYYQHDPSMEVLSQSPNTVVANHVAGFNRRSIPDNHRIFYNEVLLPQNFYHSAGCSMMLPSQNHHALIMTRNKNQGEYDKDSLKQLRIIIKHLSKALQFSQKTWELEIYNEMLSDVLGEAEIGIILFNHSGFPVYISKQAEVNIKGTNKLLLRNASLQASSSDDNSKLQKLINDSIATACGHSIDGGGCLRLGKENAIQLVVAPMNQDRFGNNRFGQPVYAAMIISKEKIDKPLPRQALIEMYGLTLAEAGLVVKLAEGHNLQAIAELNCRSKETIRSQLKSAMCKTSTKRQADLVRLVTTSSIHFASNH